MPAPLRGDHARLPCTAWPRPTPVPGLPCGVRDSRTVESPRLLYALALIQLAGLLLLGSARPPEIRVAEAERHEGQAVRVEGLVEDARTDASGRGRFMLVGDGSALAVRVQGEPPASGGWVEAEGRILRSQGLLVLHADAVREAAAPEAARPDWSEVARAPRSFTGKVLTLAGVVDGPSFGAQGFLVATGDGHWPAGGHVQATGSLSYVPSCLCYAFHALEVAAWTP
jgi:hypothetical protein